MVLVTAYSEYAMDGYELDIIDFLLKPVTFPRLMKAIQKVSSVLNPVTEIITEKEPDCIYVKTGTKTKISKIGLSDIEYIESTGNYITIFHTEGKTLLHLSLKELLEKLPPKPFCTGTQIAYYPL